jgi:acetyl esterase/lipase
MSTPQYPPLDSEFMRTYGPELLEQHAQTALLSPEEFRQLPGGVWAPDLSHGGRIAARETSILSASGSEQLPTLVLSPVEGEGPFPCVYYVANGGKMWQDAKMALTSSDTAWVADLGLVLVSVSSRVGPEHPHPAQVEDAYVGLQWIVEHADELNVDPSRIVLMGKSGGGGVAAALGLYARDLGGPAIAGQMLIYPMLDDRLDNPSSNYDVPPWSARDNQIGWRAILGDATGGPDVSPYAAAARAEDLEGLPPTYVEVGSSEVFRDESIEYAARIAKAGGSVELHSYMGGVHAFEIFGPGTKLAELCLAVRTDYLRRALEALRDGTSVAK